MSAEYSLRLRLNGSTLLTLLVSFPALVTGCGRVIVEPGASSSSTMSTSLVDETGGAGGTIATTPLSGGGGTGGAPMLTMSFSGKVVSEPEGTAVSGAQVCVLGHPQMPCTSSDSSGNFSLLLPANWETGLTLVKVGYGGVAVAFLTSTHDADGWVIGMQPTNMLTTYYEAAGYPYPDPGKGFLIAGIIDGQSQKGLAGAAISLDLLSGSGPLYADSNDAFDKSLTSTSTAGYARFAGVNSGEVEVLLSADKLSCDWDVVEGDGGGGDVTTFGGWPSAKVNSMRLPILPELETHFIFRCF